jgi:glycosyltransferase involved in cell wall biosynthesis
MKIDVLCESGSPIGVSEASIFGEDGRIGVGGSELYLLTLCHAWQEAGHDITLYNNPMPQSRSIFAQRPIASFRGKENRDILIIFRNPNMRILRATGLKIWLSCDQYNVGDFREFSKMVDKIVTISPRHATYFKDTYGITNTTTIDIPVRCWEYDIPHNKVEKRCIFTSVPDRGLMCLNAAWPLILREVPDASLTITSDWRLWSSDIPDTCTMDFRRAFLRQPNVEYLGAVNRKRLIDEQLKAQLHLYPNVYDELFCISVAESQVAGAYPITSNFGALETTNMGDIIAGDPRSPQWIDAFVERAVNYLQHPDILLEKQKKNQASAKERFSIETALERWERVFYD